MLRLRSAVTIATPLKIMAELEKLAGYEGKSPDEIVSLFIAKNWAF